MEVILTAKLLSYQFNIALSLYQFSSSSELNLDKPFLTLVVYLKEEINNHFMDYVQTNRKITVYKTESKHLYVFTIVISKNIKITVNFLQDLLSNQNYSNDPHFPRFVK